MGPAAVPLQGLPLNTGVLILLLASNLFAAVGNWMFLRKIDQALRDNRKHCDEQNAALAGALRHHHDDRRVHTLDGPEERRKLDRHERQLARLGAGDGD